MNSTFKIVMLAHKNNELSKPLSSSSCPSSPPWSDIVFQPPTPHFRHSSRRSNLTMTSPSICGAPPASSEIQIRIIVVSFGILNSNCTKAQPKVDRVYSINPGTATARQYVNWPKLWL